MLRLPSRLCNRPQTTVGGPQRLAVPSSCPHVGVRRRFPNPSEGKVVRGKSGSLAPPSSTDKGTGVDRVNGAQAGQGHARLWVPTSRRSSTTQGRLVRIPEEPRTPEGLLSVKLQFRSHPKHNPHHNAEK